MTVKQLLEKLAEMPPDSIVCWGLPSLEGEVVEVSDAGVCEVSFELGETMDETEGGYTVTTHWERKNLPMVCLYGRY